MQQVSPLTNRQSQRSPSSSQVLSPLPIDGLRGGQVYYLRLRMIVYKMKNVVTELNKYSDILQHQEMMYNEKFVHILHAIAMRHTLVKHRQR